VCNHAWVSWHRSRRRCRQQVHVGQVHRIP